MLTLERALQRRVLLFPVAALAVGVAIVLHMPIPPALKAPLLLVWLVFQYREIDAFARRSARFRKLRFSAADGISAMRPCGSWVGLRLRPGSVICARYLWLRLSGGGDDHVDALLLARRVRDCDWRRLQVLLRFTG